ncbi:hypothetical protein M513_04028 [Trichuris suis]|uniref:Uncharacterized protein n=1 Tax=Trichuris suis TaxID=68888 RepID=A0A085MD14_9BILA|nr:hypothetical protein M513_04028 [Trichuris suis]
MEALEGKVLIQRAHHCGVNSPSSSVNISMTEDILQVLPELELSPLPASQQNSCWQATTYCIPMGDGTASNTRPRRRRKGRLTLQMRDIFELVLRNSQPQQNAEDVTARSNGDCEETEQKTVD